MNIKKKILSIILSAMLIASVSFNMTACNNGTAENNSTTTTNSNGADSATIEDTTTIAEETTTQIPAPQTKDFEGKTFNITVSQYYNYHPLDVTDIEVEELTGENFDDAAYNRNTFMKEKYNCDIKITSYPSQGDAMSAIKKAVNAGDKSIDWASIRSIDFLSAISGGLAQDLNLTQSINTEAVYWNTGAINAMSMNNKVYGLFGDYTTGGLNCTWLAYFNKKFIADYDLENPYELVKSGKWTLDKMYEMGKVVAQDLDQNGVYDENDRYGISHIIDLPTSLLNSWGERYASVNSDGNIISGINTESFMNKYLKITEIFSDHQTTYNAHKRGGDTTKLEAGMFINNQALFNLGGVYYGPEMRTMDENYGILPYPKYNEAQTEYNNATSVVALPIAIIPQTANLEDSAIFLEAYAYQGYKNIRPAYYDIQLQRKTTRDEESSEMLEFIFGNIFLDMGAVYNFGGMTGTINDKCADGDTNISSIIEKSVNKIEKDIDKLVTSMESVE